MRIAFVIALVGSLNCSFRSASAEESPPRIIRVPCTLVIRMQGLPPKTGLFSFLAKKYFVQDRVGVVRHEQIMYPNVNQEVSSFHQRILGTIASFQGLTNVIRSQSLLINPAGTSHSMDIYSKVVGNKQYFWDDSKRVWNESEKCVFPEPVDGLAWEIDVLDENGTVHSTHTYEWIRIGAFISPRTEVTYQNVFAQKHDFTSPTEISFDYYAPGVGRVYHATLDRNHFGHPKKLNPKSIHSETSLLSLDGKWPQ